MTTGTLYETFPKIKDDKETNIFKELKVNIFLFNYKN